ncbi:DUF6531 domain-containing protein [Myroides fluvii]|uniref:DUF6531 domain-containing protein n=1 Tax=Myroides fluvii TaxID=2572594 RepID=UPI00131DDD64|nr:DUF6531 domain-containing protein [Myroides fluvii]
MIINTISEGLNFYSTLTGFAGQASSDIMLPLLKMGNFTKGSACLPVAKQLDPVINLVDIHMIVIPPSPAPIPMLHPFIGFSLRPKDFLALAAMSVNIAVMNAISAVITQQVMDGDISLVDGIVMNGVADFIESQVRIFIGNLGASVKMGTVLPRAIAGTSIRCLNHIPIGGGFHPIADNTITKNTGHSWLGSMFVLADGSPLVGACAHLQNVCSDLGMTSIHDAGSSPDPEKGIKAKLYMPTGMIIPIPLTRMVLTNPVPSAVNPLQVPKMLFRAGLNKLKANRIKQVKINAETGRPCSNTSRALNRVNKKLFDYDLTRGLYNKIDKKMKTYVGHPVDVAGGDLFTDSKDFDFAGIIPLSFERVWYSDSDYQGPLGYGWHHNYDMALFVDVAQRRAQARLGDGRLINFDRIPTEEFPTPRYHRSEQLWLCYHVDGFYYLRNQKEELYFFDTTPLHPKHKGFPLSSIQNRNGFAIRFNYDNNGYLKEITDSVHRVFSIVNDKLGRIIQIWVDPPEEGMQKVCIARYVYNEQGDLVEHYDEIHQPLRMMYENHLLVMETWRNGQRWFFNYDGNKTGAKCIETWGDDRIQYVKLTYYDGETHTCDGEGNRVIYKHLNQVVYETIDGNGAVWKKGYNKYGELERSMDPLGNVQNLLRDTFGNISQVIEPDGQFTQFRYLDEEYPYLPTEIIDSRGGKWSNKYTAEGKLREKCTPLGVKTKFTYNEDGLLSSITDGLGALTTLEYDKQYNKSCVTELRNKQTHYHYDLWNRCIGMTNAWGLQQRIVLDGLGRTLLINDFDGNTIEFKYDALDNVIHYQDHHRSICFTYKGMHKLVSRKEEGKTMYYRYDSNERLCRITNEEGQHFDFDLDAAGNVVQETGFDGVVKKYKRNAAGWITAVQRPANRWTKYEYNEMGQVIQVDYSDDQRESYTYEAGLLRQAVNSSGILSFRYDAQGKLVEENFEGQKVERTYDDFGRCMSLKSSLGADFEFQYDACSNVTESQYNDWKVMHAYDSLGKECVRTYTGGMQQTWKFDKVGRLQTQRTNKQEISGISISQFYRDYVWNTGALLLEITEQGHKKTGFQRDKRGFLQGVIYDGGELEERGVDASGNLYRQLNCKDSVYVKNRLQETNTAQYKYDKEGFLIEKEEKYTGKKWKYEWNGAGMLSQVLLPDGHKVGFAYDALGRRVRKYYKNAITHYVWREDVVLHEYKTFDARETTAEDMITWVFEEDSFIPMAKLKGDARYSLVTDHLGTPIRAYTAQGDKVWERELDSCGNTRWIVGEDGFCNFLYQGQLYDKETGLAYNRFRYYDPEVGNYIAQDPIGLAGNNPTLYGYVSDPTKELDVFGLSKSSSYGWKSTAERLNYRPHHKQQFKQVDTRFLPGV